MIGSEAVLTEGQIGGAHDSEAVNGLGDRNSSRGGRKKSAKLMVVGGAQWWQQQCQQQYVSVVPIRSPGDGGAVLIFEN